jgi:hypothetical protein
MGGSVHSIESNINKNRLAHSLHRHLCMLFCSLHFHYILGITIITYDRINRLDNDFFWLVLVEQGQIQPREWVCI